MIAHTTPLSRSHGWTRAGTGVCVVALLLLCLGCLNPLIIDKVQTDVDHAPVVTHMSPQPSFGRLDVNAGKNCAPLTTWRADRLDDADLDTLTVRWTLLLPSADNPDGRTTSLPDIQLDPQDPPVNDVVYAFAPFTLDRTTVLRFMESTQLSDQAANHSDVGQLLELRISDGGFKSGTDDAPDGFVVFFQSWAIVLRNTDC